MVVGTEVGKALASTCKVVMAERLKDWVGLESYVYNCLCETARISLTESVPLCLCRCWIKALALAIQTTRSVTRNFQVACIQEEPSRFSGAFCLQHGGNANVTLRLVKPLELASPNHDTTKSATVFGTLLFGIGYDTSLIQNVAFLSTSVKAEPKFNP
jgi:hypothetical protein